MHKNITKLRIQTYLCSIISGVLIILCAAHSSFADPFSRWNSYWGDLHCHAKFSADSNCEGFQITPEQFFINARLNHLDFAALTEHDAIMGIDDLTPHWERIKRAAINSSGPLFVGIAGFEWSNNNGALNATGIDWLYKHRVVLFPHSYGGPLFQSYKPQYATTHGFLEAIKNHAPEAVVDNAHPYADFRNLYDVTSSWDYSLEDAGLKSFIYVTEICRSFNPRGESPDPFFNFEKSINKALSSISSGGKLFIKPGFIGVSDVPHDGHPGNNCLTCLYADELTDRGIFDALRKKRSYATSGPRMIIKFWAVSPNLTEHIMGEEFQVNPAEIVTFSWEIITSSFPEHAISEIDIISNDSVIWKEIFPLPNNRDNGSYSVTILSDDYFYLRIIQTNGHAGWSSPIYISTHTSVPVLSKLIIPVIVLSITMVIAFFLYLLYLLRFN
ncbi:MAG: hypothetical protein A2161_11880 [Candidatus Schekmanbacteria bacterium RBG_13_48_7]|uniref:Polymerase/histidinol phosphatase N-terminal domain-containing protein n=1 Tax=Candidatus Schekmanbacteria bacterium RBG_13_48_7 TaxID=1817878 RepID=A0A1F7S1C7_9BACT|nr:MAG: hypothetical protein A2161_11880 [Candidatus Schekmanbacteria bacterium RBG_13_48_7]